MPQGVSKLSLFHVIGAVGTLTIDDVSLVEEKGSNVFPTISNQILGNTFTLSLNTSNIPTGSKLTLTTTFGNIYPSSITTTGTLTSTNVYITSASGNISISASVNGSVVGTSNTFSVSSPTSCLQEYSLQGLCVPSSPSTPDPKSLSPGTYTSPGPELNSISQTFSWSPVSGASKYAFYLRNLKTGALIVVNETLNTNSFTYNYLEPLTNYRWNIVAYDNSGKSGWYADPLYFTTSSFASTSVDPNLNGQVEITVTDGFGIPVENAVVTYECVDVATNICPLVNGTKLTGQTTTDLLGKIVINTGTLGVIPNLLVKVYAKEIYSATSGVAKSIVTTIKTQNYITKNVVLNGAAIVISLTPVIGEAYDIVTLASGKDPITGESLDTIGKFFTIGGLITGIGSGKVARIAGNESLKAIAKIGGYSIDNVLHVADEVASEIPLSTVSDVTTLFSKGSGEITDTVAAIGKRSGYRAKLINYLGVTDDVAREFDAHHVMPQYFIKTIFEKVNIDISAPQYMVLWKRVTVDSTSHQSLAKQYNDEWAAWLSKKGPSFTREEVLAQAQFMFTKYQNYYQTPVIKVGFTK